MWRLDVAEVSNLHNFKKLQLFMGGYYAHFLFDIFREFSCKGVFLYLFLTFYQSNQIVLSGKLTDYFEPNWPEVQPHCRSPPTPFRFTIP